MLDRELPSHRVDTSYLAVRETHLLITDDVLRAAYLKSVPEQAPTARMVAFCNLVALLDRDRCQPKEI